MKNFKSRILSVVLALGMLVVSGCSEADTKKDSTKTSSAVTTTTNGTTTSPETTAAPETTQNPSQNDPLSELPESDITPAMWKIETDSGATIYFMGSMHALPKSAHSFPQEIMNAYEQSDAIAVECDTVAFAQNLPAQLALSMSMIYSDGTTIKDHLSEDLYTSLVDKMTEWGIYSSAYDSMKPFAWQSFIEDYFGKNSEIVAEYGFDEYFMKKAKSDKKEIIEVESIDFQLDMLMNFSDEIYEVLLSSYLEYTPETYCDELTELYNQWSGGNIEEIEEYLTSDYDEDTMTADEILAMKEYDNQMIHQRNKGMADKLIELSKGDKNVFYYVGLAHFVGDTGILAELDKAGIEYEKVEYN